MKYLLCLLFILAFSGCSKPDPAPELKDPIYSDLNNQYAATTQAIDAEKKVLEGHLKDLSGAIPQTGQTKLAQKRVRESKDKITRLEQEAKYLKLKIDARKKTARSSYQEAYKSQKAWPDPNEWKVYEAEKRFREAKRNWDVKQRIKDELGPKEQKNPAAEGHGGH